MSPEHSPDVPAGPARPKRRYRRRRLPLLADFGRTIVVKLPRCKQCNAPRLVRVRTEYRDKDAGEFVQRMECPACGEQWAVTYEH